METNFDAWLEAEMRVFYMVSRQRLTADCLKFAMFLGTYHRPHK